MAGKEISHRAGCGEGMRVQDRIPLNKVEALERSTLLCGDVVVYLEVDWARDAFECGHSVGNFEIQYTCARMLARVLQLVYVNIPYAMDSGTWPHVRRRDGVIR